MGNVGAFGAFLIVIHSLTKLSTGFLYFSPVFSGLWITLVLDWYYPGIVIHRFDARLWITPDIVDNLRSCVSMHCGCIQLLACPPACPPACPTDWLTMGGGWPLMRRLKVRLSTHPQQKPKIDFPLNRLPIDRLSYSVKTKNRPVTEKLIATGYPHFVVLSMVWKPKYLHGWENLLQQIRQWSILPRFTCLYH